MGTGRDPGLLTSRTLPVRMPPAGVKPSVGNDGRLLGTGRRRRAEAALARARNTRRTNASRDVERALCDAARSCACGGHLCPWGARSSGPAGASPRNTSASPEARKGIPPLLVRLASRRVLRGTLFADELARDLASAERRRGVEVIRNWSTGFLDYILP